MRAAFRWTLLSLAALVSAASFASSQEIQTSSVDVGPPRRITATAAAMATPPAAAKAYGDQKQDRLGEHFRPTIDLIPTAGAQAAADAPQPRATTVVGGPIRAATSLRIFSSHALTDGETNDITSTVTEPSVAVRGQEILVTGNWFASFSTNGGNSFTYVNPDTTFPTAAGGFCCDQVAIYDRQHDLMIWFLQYITNAQGNVARVAVAQGNDIPNQNWRFYDFSPQSVGNWQNEWFDYPDMALGDKFLYITSNTFSTSANGFTRAVILRLPLQEMANYQGFNYRFYDTNQVASIRPTQGATDTMYLGAHRNLSSIRVFTWPETSTTINRVDVPVAAWSSATRVAPGPDGNDWLGRTDGRITAAGLAGNNIALGWTAAQDATHPFPHARVALIDKNTKNIVFQPTIWNTNFAFAYPAFAPNNSGMLGVSVHFGGGSQLFPSHAVGVLDRGNSWNLLSSANGTNGPSRNRWGDYLAIRRHAQQPSTWVATGFTLQGGEERQDIQVRYIHYGKDDEGGGDELEDCRRKLRELREQLKNLRIDIQKILDQIDEMSAAQDRFDSQTTVPRKMSVPQAKHWQVAKVAEVPCCR